MVHKFAQALSKGCEADLPSREDKATDESAAEGKKKAGALKRNAVAVASFAMALATKGLVGLSERQ